MNEDDDITNNQRRIDGIKADIRQGKDYEIIAEKWETTVNYVRKIASKMRKDGEELIDRCSKEWRTLQFMVGAKYYRYKRYKEITERADR